MIAPIDTPARTGHTPPSVNFRPATVTDLPLIAAWLMEPHVRRFYQKTPISLSEVEAEFGPMVRGETTDICHIAISDGVPFGYVQSYRNRDESEWANLIGASDGISLDLFIGPPGYVGKGFGRALLAGYLHRVAFPRFAEAACAYIAHETVNERARRCSEAVGFKPLREFHEYGLPMQLYRLEREALSRSMAR